MEVDGGWRSDTERSVLYTKRANLLFHFHVTELKCPRQSNRIAAAADLPIPRREFDSDNRRSLTVRLQKLAKIRKFNALLNSPPSKFEVLEPHFGAFDSRNRVFARCVCVCV